MTGFWGFLNHSPLLWQIYYISLYSILDIWITHPFPLLINVVYERSPCHLTKEWMSSDTGLTSATRASASQRANHKLGVIHKLNGHRRWTGVQDIGDFQKSTLLWALFSKTRLGPNLYKNDLYCLWITLCLFLELELGCRVEGPCFKLYIEYIDSLHRVI